VIKDKDKTPICPACGAKFSHSIGNLCCKKCGIPDEVVYMGHLAIARWKKQKARADGQTKREAKKIKWGGHKKSLRRKKHGRPV